MRLRWINLGVSGPNVITRWAAYEDLDSRIRMNVYTDHADVWFTPLGAKEDQFTKLAISDGDEAKATAERWYELQMLQQANIHKPADDAWELAEDWWLQLTDEALVENWEGLGEAQKAGAPNSVLGRIKALAYPALAPHIRHPRKNADAVREGLDESTWAAKKALSPEEASRGFELLVEEMVELMRQRFEVMERRSAALDARERALAAREAKLQEALDSAAAEVFQRGRKDMITQIREGLIADIWFGPKSLDRKEQDK